MGLYFCGNSLFGLELTRTNVGISTDSFELDSTLNSNFDFLVTYDGSNEEVNIGTASILGGNCSSISEFACVDNGDNTITITIPIKAEAKISGYRNLTATYSIVDIVGKEYENVRVLKGVTPVTGDVYVHGDINNLSLEVTGKVMGITAKALYKSVFKINFVMGNL